MIPAQIETDGPVGPLRVVVLLAQRAAAPPVIVFTLHVIASRVLSGYEHWPGLDVPMHFLGGVAIACFFERALAVLRATRWLEPAGPRLDAVLLLALVSSATVLWEFAEFLSDRTFGTRSQLGLEDTLGDMAVGIAGGLLWLGVIGLRRARATRVRPRA